MSAKPTEELQSVAIRFTGDSGDGMQLTGTKFTESTALAGNDLSTLPDYPAEIRAPAGTLAGVFVPLILRRMGVDPALAGTVVLTTVTDVVGFFSFLGLATLFLVN